MTSSVPAERARSAADPPNGVPVRPSIVVIGDVLLDREWCGNRRNPSERSAPLLADVVERVRPGGAALVAWRAHQAANSTADVTLIAAFGAGRVGGQVKEMTRAIGVETIDIAHHWEVSERMRIIDDEHLLLQIDRATTEGASVRASEAPSDTAARIDAALHNADAVCVADHGGRVATHPMLLSRLAMMGNDVPIVWDPHPTGICPSFPIDLFAPSRDEASLMIGNADDDCALATRVSRAMRSCVAVMLGDRGVAYSDGSTAYVRPVALAHGPAIDAPDSFVAAYLVARAGRRSAAMSVEHALKCAHEHRLRGTAALWDDLYGASGRRTDGLIVTVGRFDALDTDQLATGSK